MYGNLSGTLPAAYSSWANMSTFILSHNANLGGTLPPEYKSWVKLDTLFLHAMSLTGTLPAEYASMTRLSNFYVYDNFLHGSLPPEYSSWHNIALFQVFDNNFSGTLPSGYGLAWKNVTTLIVTNSSISGTLPPEWGGMTSLVSLFLHSNELSGSLPASLGNLPHLTHLTLADNNFAGEVPFSAWSRLSNVVLLLLHDNPALTGTIPISWNGMFVKANILKSVVGLVSICRTRLCGPYLPVLPFGYGCIPSYVLRKYVLTLDNGVQALAPLTTFEYSVPCIAKSSKSTTTTFVVPQPATSDFSQLQVQLVGVPLRLQQAARAAPIFTTFGATLTGAPTSNGATDLQLLTAVLQSTCMCGSVASTSSAMSFSRSPFADAGRIAVILGNMGLVMGMYLFHRGLVTAVVAFRCRQHSTSNQRDGDVTSVRKPKSDVSTLWQLPKSIQSSRTAAASNDDVSAVASILRFPNGSVRVAVLLLPGIYQYAFQILLGYAAPNVSSPSSGEVVSAVIGLLFGVGTYGVLEVVLYRRNILQAVHARILAFRHTDYKRGSIASKFMKVGLSSGQWRPKEFMQRCGCLISGLRGSCDHLWRCMPLLNILTQLLGAIPASGSSGCSVVQVLMSLVALSGCAFYATKRPTRVPIASFFSALSLLLTSSVSLSGMLCREELVSEEVVMRLALAVTIVSMFSTVYSFLGMIVERFLEQRLNSWRHPAKHNNNTSSPTLYGVSPATPGRERRSSQVSSSPPPLLSLVGTPPPPMSSTLSKPAVAGLRSPPKWILYDTHYERLEELVQQICRRRAPISR